MTEMIPLPLLRRLYEAGLPLLCLIVVARSWRKRGAAITSREFIFGFLLSQSVEFLAVQYGRYRYPDWVVYFPPSPAWVPLGIGLGWAAFVPVVMCLSERILGRRSALWKLGALDGLLAVGIDLVLDPAVSGEPLRMWLWHGDGMTLYRYWLMGVPVFNFVGWVLLIGVCGYQLRAVEARLSGWRRWGRLTIFLAADLAVAAAVMRLPW